jgi:hypothetical protein
MNHRVPAGLVVAACLLALARPAAAETRSAALHVDLRGTASTPEQLRFGLTAGPQGLGVPAGGSGFVEAQLQAPFRFSAVGLVLHGAFPQGARVEAEVQVSADGKRWREPVALPVEADLSEPGEEIQAHGLLVLPSAEARFCRWRLALSSSGPAVPRVASADLHFIDATDGPSEMDLLLLRERPSPRPRVSAQTLPKPSVVSRAEWGARPPSGSYEYCQPSTHLCVHYTASQGLPDDNLSECAAHVRAIQAYHMDSRGWIDVGYNYLICRHGTIFEARGGGDDVRGAHDGYNCDSMGVCAIGYFHPPYNEPVTSAILDSYIALFAWKASQNHIDPKGRTLYRSYGALMDNLYGHRNVRNTSCPGDALYAQLGFLREEVQARLDGTPTPLGNLVGLILEAGSNVRLAGATCDLTPGGRRVVTGSDGYYRFEDLTAGQTYTVSVTHAGHVPQSKSRLVEAGIDNWNSLWLEPAASATVAVR